MKLINNKNFDLSDDFLFGVSLRSNSGVNVKVGEKYYNMVIDSTGSYLVKEFLLEFELTEEEFKKRLDGNSWIFNKKD